ncbi:MAG: YdcF family protein [Bacteroidales bacterium]|nr:YdcF family protein [Clostridium sp.]MCM1202626.1 YdcF family protein [Bacteroidales bacterium]
MKRRMTKSVLFAAAAFSLAYFVLLMCTIGAAYRFNYVWLLMGLCFLGLAVVIALSGKAVEKLPRGVVAAVNGIVFIGCLLFVIVEGLIIGQSLKEPKEKADYLIVLGAKVNGTQPSKILEYRIEKAYTYLKQNPDVRVIVSGGKGSDEDISEAQAMYNGLVERGIEKERIYREDKSTSTKENLDFSKSCMEEIGLDIEKERVLIVTTDFHVLRAVGIAKKAGYRNVEGLAADSVWYLVPTNYVREFLAVVKDKLVGNL